jgi:hypothetical protein
MVIVSGRNNACAACRCQAIFTGQLACRRRAPNSKAHHLEVNLACGGLVFLDLLDGRDQAAIGGHAGQVRFRDDAAVDQLGHDIAALSATLLSEVLWSGRASRRDYARS